MAQRLVSFKDLVLGGPVRRKLFSSWAGGPALPEKNPQPAPAIQADGLLEAASFAEREPAPSVLHQLNQSNRRLALLLQNLRNEHNAEAELRDIARDVIQAVELNPDIALASIFLSQIAGSYAVRHCIETAVVAVVVARGLHKTPADILTLTAAALTMNVGMLHQHESFQNKNAPLTREEMAIVRRHPEDSADLLKCAGIEDEEWIACVMLHHENDDGSGYPLGKAGAELPFSAKLISLADRYCAQVSARNYRRSVLPDQAMRNLMEDRDAPVDAMLAQQFVHELGYFPPGSLVRLQNGEVGVVTRRLDDGGLGVQALRNQAGAPLPPATERRTMDHSCAVAEALTEDQAAVRFSMKQIWGVQASL